MHWFNYVGGRIIDSVSYINLYLQKLLCYQAIQVLH